MAPSPKNVTVYGRLSFPTWTAKEAYDLSQKGSYPAADVASSTPSFMLLVTDAQWSKFYKHATEVFLPYCVEQNKKGEKRDSLTAAEVKALTDCLDDLANAALNTPAKVVHEKSAELAPEAVATIKVLGSKGQDMDLKAIVNDESELAVPDPDILSFPVVRPIAQTTHQMYPGALVAVTLNLYAYHNGKHAGFSAGAASNTAVFKADAERFGGSGSVDVDEMFMD